MAGALTIVRSEDSLVLDDGRGFPISRLAVDGAMRVPADDYPMTVQVTLVLGAGEGDPDAGSVKCDLVELSDERGWFQSVRTVAAPTQDWEVEGFVAAVVPDFALVAARAGARDLVARVRVLEGQDPHRVIGEGCCAHPLNQQEPGFLEWPSDELQGDRHVAALAVATAAVDRTVHESEVNVIRRFFRTRYEGRPDADDLRAQVSLTLQRSLRRIESGSASPARLIEDASSVLLHEYAVSVRRTAYILAVRVAAADRVLAGQERGLLEVVASSLGLPADEMATARDRIRAEAQFVAEHLRAR